MEINETQYGDKEKNLKQEKLFESLTTNPKVK